MKIRERAICIFKILKNNDDISLRELAEQTAIPKSSVHRHKTQQQTRINSVGHSFFETKAGLEWLHRLFFAVIFIFGIQAGVGAETLSLFFSLILLTSYVATSSSGIREIKQKMRNLIGQYGKAQTSEILTRCQNKELHLGADETWFGNSLFLVLMELTSGFIFTEALAENRTYKTWQKYAGNLFKRFKKVLSFSSDGGCALLKLGKDASCKNLMDLFHLLQDVKRLFATIFHSKRRSLLAKLKKLKKKPFSSEDEQTQVITAIKDKLVLLESGQKHYRNALFTISTQSHPFKNMSEKKSSAELEEQLREQLNGLRSIVQSCKIEDKRKLLNRFEKRIKASSRLNDLWHDWVEQSVLCKTNDSEIKTWATHYLLPFIYFKEQLRKSKKKERLKSYYQDLVEKAKAPLEAHPLTEDHLTEDWMSWAKAMALKYQRTTSAIEGRNARLAQHYFSSRGVRRTHIKSLTIIHNFWIKRDDNSTAAQRLCGFKPPDLFEWLLKNMRELPLPRNGCAKITASIC